MLDYSSNSYNAPSPTAYDSLRQRVVNQEIGARTVVALERLQYGDNLGMKDVIALSDIMEHNQKAKTEKDKIKIPKQLSGSLIESDAKLYLEARKNGVKVIGIEGKNLKHELGSELHDANREEYMARMIDAVRSRGFDVIVNVGEAHKKQLESGLQKLENKQSKGKLAFGASMTVAANKFDEKKPKIIQEDRLKISDFKPPSMPGQKAGESWAKRVRTKKNTNSLGRGS